jgi:hypothetical protein
MTQLTRSQLEAAWSGGHLHSVGHEVDGEANIIDLFDSLVLVEDYSLAMGTHPMVATSATRAKLATISSMVSGTTTLGSDGVAIVTTTAVQANTRIFLTGQNDGGIPGWLRVSERTPGVSFTIKSSEINDQSVVAWLLLNDA